MSSSNQAPARKSRGRQKVSMVKMSNESNLQVTFSKRRAGLFKKASELCTLCGAEAAIVVFSPAQKVFCFGHPNVQTVIDRFEQLYSPRPLMTNNINNARSQLIIEAHRNSTIRELNLELTQIESLFRAEKRRAEELELLRKSGEMQGWFVGSLDGLNLAQLSVLKESIMDFKNKFDVKVQNDMFALANPLPNFYPPGGNKENPRGFGGNNIISCVPTFNNNINNAQFSLGLNDFSNPYNHHGAVGFGDSNIGLFGHFKGNYGSIDQGLSVPMATNMATNGLGPIDYHQNVTGNITAGFGSSQVYDMAFDPRLL